MTVRRTDRTEDEEAEGRFYMKIPKSIPISIVIAILIQICAVVWAVSSFYKENQLMQETISSQFQSLQGEIASIKGSIYTRSEALVLEKRIDKAEDRLMWLERQGYESGKSGRPVGK